jgi:membrane protease YdiL (CAAX protease family)
MDPPGGDNRSRRYGFGDWTPDPGRRPTSAAVAVVLAFALAIAGFVVAFVLFNLASLFVDTNEFSVVQLTVFGLVILQGVSFPLVAYGYLRVRELPLSFLRLRRPTVGDIGLGVGGFALAFLLVITAGVVISVAGLPAAERADSEALQNPQVLLALIPLSILVIGPGEEVLFRGVIQTTLREAFGAPVAIVLASAAFAPAHILALVGSPEALLVTISVLFLPSLVFGAVYEYAENLVVPALSHGLYNALLFSLTFVSLGASEGLLAGPL